MKTKERNIYIKNPTFPIGRAKDVEKYKARKEWLKNVEKSRRDFYY